MLTGKQQNNSKSPLHSIFSTSNCTFHTFFFLSTSFSIHFIAQAAHDNLFFDKTFSNHFLSTQDSATTTFSTQDSSRTTFSSSKQPLNHQQLILRIFCFLSSSFSQHFRQKPRFRHYQGMYSTSILLKSISDTQTDSDSGGRESKASFFSLLAKHQHFWILLASHIFLPSQKKMHKLSLPLPHHTNFSLIKRQRKQQSQKRITAFSNEISNPPLITSFTQKHYQRRSTSFSTLAFSLIPHFATKNGIQDYALLTLDRAFFFAVEDGFRGKVLWTFLLAFCTLRGHCIRSLFFLLLFWHTSQRQPSLCYKTWKTWEKLHKQH